MIECKNEHCKHYNEPICDKHIIEPQDGGDPYCTDCAVEEADGGHECAGAGCSDVLTTKDAIECGACGEWVHGHDYDCMCSCLEDLDDDKRDSTFERTGGVLRKAKTSKKKQNYAMELGELPSCDLCEIITQKLTCSDHLMLCRECL